MGHKSIGNQASLALLLVQLLVCLVMLKGEEQHL